MNEQTNDTEMRGIEDSVYEFSPRQRAQYDAIEQVTELFGKYDQGIGEAGAHYGAPSPFASEGLVCASCVYYEGPRACEVVDGDIAPDGICKLWIIPEQLIGGATQTMNNDTSAPSRAQTIESVMKRDELNNVREVRQFALSNVEVREDQSSGTVNFVGYATVFDHDYEVTDQFGNYTERIAPGAFTRTLGESPDVVLNLNHGAGGTGLPVARTKSGTLTLTQDSIGLRVSSTLDPSDPDVQAILPKMRRGDLDEMSMAFRVPSHGQVWSDDYSDRTITEINLARGDVSIVSFGANPATVAALRAALAVEDTRAALLTSSDTEIVPGDASSDEQTEQDDIVPVETDETERSSLVVLLDRLLDARRLD